MIYIDTSSLLKTLWTEVESDTVRDLVTAEDQVIISSLVELETEVQLRAQWMGGAYGRARYRDYRKQLDSFRETAPFEFRELPGAVFRRAVEQHNLDETVHCRSIDRLHLAAMAELGLHRLLTNDVKQAAAARALAFEVILSSATSQSGRAG